MLNDRNVATWLIVVIESSCMRIVSLISGCGGLDLGMIGAGYDVNWANDINADSDSSYAAYIGHQIVHNPLEQGN